MGKYVVLADIFRSLADHLRPEKRVRRPIFRFFQRCQMRRFFYQDQDSADIRENAVMKTDGVIWRKNA